MENITIGQIAGALGILAGMLGSLAVFYNVFKKTISDKIDKNKADIASNCEEIKELKEEVKRLKSEIADSKEERLILLKAQLACLKGLKEQGCNGPVAQAIGDIEDYLMKKSHD